MTNPPQFTSIPEFLNKRSGKEYFGILTTQDMTLGPHDLGPGWKIVPAVLEVARYVIDSSGVSLRITRGFSGGVNRVARTFDPELLHPEIGRIAYLTDNCTLLPEGSAAVPGAHLFKLEGGSGHFYASFYRAVGGVLRVLPVDLIEGNDGGFFDVTSQWMARIAEPPLR